MFSNDQCYCYFQPERAVKHCCSAWCLSYHASQIPHCVVWTLLFWFCDLPEMAPYGLIKGNGGGGGLCVHVWCCCLVCWMRADDLHVAFINSVCHQLAALWRTNVIHCICSSFFPDTFPQISRFLRSLCCCCCFQSQLWILFSWKTLKKFRNLLGCCA